MKYIDKIKELCFYLEINPIFSNQEQYINIVKTIIGTTEYVALSCFNCVYGENIFYKEMANVESARKNCTHSKSKKIEIVQFLRGETPYTLCPKYCPPASEEILKKITC